MKKYIGIISLFTGIIANIYTFFYNNNFNIDIKFILVSELIGILISIFTLVKYKERIISSIGFLLNLIPLVYVIFLYFAIG